MRFFSSAPWLKQVMVVGATVCMFTGAAIAANPPQNKTQYSPNFKGTELTEFINIVGKNLKKTMIVDPNVRGKINIRSYDVLNEQQYYQFFLNVLEVYGFAAVEMDNNIIKIIRDKEAKSASIPLVDSNSPGIGDEMVTRVVEVKNVTVRELNAIAYVNSLNKVVQELWFTMSQQMFLL